MTLAAQPCHSRTIAPKLPLLAEIKERENLWLWLKQHLGLHLPRRPFCPHHNTPFDYVAATYFEPSVDLIVHGPRGGGKTRLAAAATLLDLLHKPGINIRVLGGSLEQSLRVWEHLVPDIETLAEDQLVKSRSRSRRIDLESGSSAAVLTQSQRNVRGQRVQKMRCDEVEMFDPAVWAAVGATTRSMKAQAEGDEKIYAGVVEALSTHHEAYGLMSQILDGAVQKNTRVIRWCVLDVLAPCEPARDCSTCALSPECGGRAKLTWPGTDIPQADGFLSVDDVLRIKNRLSQEKWEAEMLCLRPTRDALVFPSFNPAIHVREFTPTFPLSLGVDFGFAAPFVALFIGVDAKGVVHVADEYLIKGMTVTEHTQKLLDHPSHARTIYCDPAGRSRNEQTGKSSVNVFRDAGFVVHCRGSQIQEGIEQIRLLCRDANGQSRLVVHPKCTQLLKALRQYHYPKTGLRELPEKDGENDHPIDALRYWVIHHTAPRTVASRGV